MSISDKTGEPGRRTFLKTSVGVGGALVVTFQLPFAFGNRVHARSTEATALGDGWLLVHPDNRIVLRVASAEMGQGVSTAMPALLAEELEVDWTAIETEAAPVAKPFTNLAFNMQATGGSTSIRWSFNYLRQVGAGVRELMKLAAANIWSVPVVECTAYKGEISHAPSSRSATYGELATIAAGLSAPTGIPFKPRAEWRLLGKPIQRLDSEAKATGTAQFGIDTELPGMLVATVIACPTFGGTLKSVDKLPALSVTGVKQVVQLSDAVIVLATGYWPAHKGLLALTPIWEHGTNAGNDTQAIQKQLTEGLERSGAAAETNGDATAAIGAAEQTIEATYQAPFLAHATMEPMNATVHLHNDSADVWVPTQAPGLIPGLVAKLTGISPERVIVHTTFLGGGFGRRFELDFVAQATLAAKSAGVPVKLLWSREEDMRHDFYRPASASRLQAGITNGRLVGLNARVCSPSIMSRVFPDFVRNGLDQSSVEGITQTIYDFDTLKVEYVHQEVGVPVGFWRAVGHSQNIFFLESFIDEIAHSAKRDPLALRQELLQKKPRQLNVLNRAAELGNWGQAGSGRVQGIAIAESFGSIVAEVIEASITDNTIQLHNVNCVVDCGVAINPDTISAQMESSIVYGLTAAMHGRINISDGSVVETNFDTYPMLKLAQMPAVSTTILQSEGGNPGGIGEPGLPPAAPALCNAIFSATGKRIRSLPLSEQGWTLLNSV